MGEKDIQEACLKGDLTKQWQWHEAFRDASKNMYRTTYADTIHGREVAVKSEFPSGYGGHDPVVQHDTLFKNTRTYDTLQKMALDPKRDTFPCFQPQKYGCPTYAKAGSGMHNDAVPDMSVHPPPWAATDAIRRVPSYKMTPNMDARNS